MTQVQEWLFSHYAEPRLDESLKTNWLQTLMKEFALPPETQIALMDQITHHQLFCSQKAFALGLSFGMQLCTQPTEIDNQ